MFGRSVDPRIRVEPLVEGGGPTEQFPSGGPTAWARRGQSTSRPKGPGPARSQAFGAIAAALWREARTPRKGGGAPAAAPRVTTPSSGISPRALVSNRLPAPNHPNPPPPASPPPCAP